jgi:hypothetical protein
MNNQNSFPPSNEISLNAEPLPQTMSQAEFQHAETLDFMVTHAPETHPNTALLVNDVRGSTHFVHSLLVGELPKLAKLPANKAAALLQAYGLDDALKALGKVRHRWRFEEHIELALNCAQVCGLLDLEVPATLRQSLVSPYLRTGQELARESMVAWLQLYRFWLGSREFKERLRLRALTLERARRQVHEYVTRLFAARARLLVIRLDLDYRAKHALGVSIEEARADLRRCFVNLRASGQFDDHVGYVWRLEDGEKTGYHFHVALFLDGSRVREDISHAQLLGDYWAKFITNGRGRYWNCNADMRPHRRSGIGMIHHSDMEKRAELTKALDYLIKADQEVLIRSGRSMGHGQVEEKPMVGPGRPRNPPPETQSAETSPFTYLPDDSANLP